MSDFIFIYLGLIFLFLGFLLYVYIKGKNEGKRIEQQKQMEGITKAKDQAADIERSSATASIESIKETMAREFTRD